MVGNAFSRRPSGRRAAVVGVVLVVVGAVTAGVVLQANPTVLPGPSPVTSGQPSAGTSTGTPAQWSALDLPPMAMPATLEPSVGDDAGIAANASFILASLTDEPATELAARLEVTPEAAFTIAPAADAATATITPVGPLATGDTYRFALRSPDGVLAASWAFRVRGPINVVGTIPGDAMAGVPLATGVEVTFDQEGVADIADHFSIEPEVTGRFERHGRTQVFVPSALAPATTYTVTVRAGLARTGTDLELLDDVVFRFETEAPVDPQPWIVFGREVLEAAPTERLDIAVYAVRPWVGIGQLPAPTTADVRVYRLPNLDAANEALAEFLSAPRWTEFSEPLMRTDGLRVVADFEARLQPLRYDVLLLRLPASLDPGWYIVEIQGVRRAQAFLQVTPVSAWVSAMHDQTVVWVNDVTTHTALSGATVAVGAGSSFATSNDDGLAIGATPNELLPPAAGGHDRSDSLILRVTSTGGDVVLVPFNVGGNGQAYRGEWWETFGSADETYWALLYTDRGSYRRTDTVQVWGYLRDRDDGAVPASVRVRLVANGEEGDVKSAAISSVDVRPSVDGAFTASMPIAGLPLDAYQVQAIADGRIVMSRWIQVTTIHKPLYQLEVSGDHRAVITGTPVTMSATATFFDGTPVASLDLEVASSGGLAPQRITTDAAGDASVEVQTATESTSYPDWQYASVRPVGPEGAEISTAMTTVVFPTAYQIKAEATLVGSELRLTGTLAEVDLVKVERALLTGWDGDASGAPVVGRVVDVEVYELVPVRRQVGSEYDFIEKVVRPAYEYDYRRDPVQFLTIESGAGGSLSFSIPVPSAEDQYAILLSTRDDTNRLLRFDVSASPERLAEPSGTGVQFASTDGKRPDELSYGIGDMVAWNMTEDGEPAPSGGANRYLYLIAQDGLRAAVATDAPRFRHRYTDDDAPGIFVIGVRFTGSTYAPKAGAWANFDTRDREIQVRVTADKARYRPGDLAALSIRTTRPDGTAVPATVVLQAVDEKLYAIGGAYVPAPLADLYDRVDSGIVRLAATHQLPTMSGPEGEGGDTTGGGGDERADFRDSILFREVRTDASGRAMTAVRLSDDLTSWRVVASAVTGDLRAGVGELLLPVGLPFFVEVTLADSYHVADRPVVQVRAFGERLRAGDVVEFTVASPSLGLAATRVRGTAFVPVSVDMPALTVGSRAITASAVAHGRDDAAGNPLTDSLTRTFDVVGSRLSATQAAYGSADAGLPAVPDGAEQTLWTFSDAGRGRLIPLLSSIAASSSARLDRLIAQQLAGELLVAEFGGNPAHLPTTFDPSRYAIGQEYDREGLVTRLGVALVQGGGVDPWLAARIAATAPNALHRESLVNTLLGIVELPTTRRDLQIAALAGMAGLGEPVLADLQAAYRQTDLTPSEQIYLALGFEAIGDHATAIAIERGLLTDHGEGLGQWVRLGFETTDDGADATALLALIAAGIGDPLAAGMAEYALANPAIDSVNAMELTAYARRTLERTPAAAASFVYTVEGKRSTVRLEPGEAFGLRLTPAQAATLSAETLTGQVGVAVEARVPVAAASLRPHVDLELTRTIPAMPIAADRIVEVNLTATFADTAPDGCYDVTEQVPSGLAPLEGWWGQTTDDTTVTWPSRVAGQEVRFCAWNDPETGRTARLRYLARVVNEGAFAWEPAVMQLPAAPDLLAITPAGTASIGTR